jgi:mediator of RNA polymerase II transcription subunit 6
MSLFSVSHGHTYYKPVKPSTRQALSGGAGPQSREGSVAPESRASTAEKPAASSQSNEESGSGARTAWEALRMTIAYGKEYSDDMPLVGEPGNFRFSKNKDATATAGQTKAHGQTLSSPNGTPAHSRAGSVAAPPPSNAAAPPRAVRAGDKVTPISDGAAKVKRKKSRVDGGSP